MFTNTHLVVKCIIDTQILMNRNIQFQGWSSIMILKTHILHPKLYILLKLKNNRLPTIHLSLPARQLPNKLPKKLIHFERSIKEERKNEHARKCISILCLSQH